MHINIGGWEERETYLFGSRYRSTYVFQAGKNGEGKASSLYSSCLGFWPSEDFNFPRQEWDYFAKAKTFFMYSSRVASIHTVYILFLWSSQAHNTPKAWGEVCCKERQQSEPSQEAYCSQQPVSDNVMPFLHQQNPLFLIIVLINILV